MKGIWINIGRGLELANREGITDMLYPLFVHNIRGLLDRSVSGEWPTKVVVPKTDFGYASKLNDISTQNSERGHNERAFSADGNDIDIGSTITVNPASTANTYTNLQRYIIEFSKIIYDSFQPPRDATTWSMLQEKLPGFIKTFSIKIGEESPTRANREIMYLTYKYHLYGP